MKGGLILNRSRQVPAEDTAAFGGIAERFRRAGDLDRAITLCRDGLKKFPALLSARVTLGWSLLDKGQYAEARAELEQVLRRAPDNLAAIRGLAELHDRTEHLSGAENGEPGWHHSAEAREEQEALDLAIAAASTDGVAGEDEPLAVPSMGQTTRIEYDTAPIDLVAANNIAPFEVISQDLESAVEPVVEEAVELAPVQFVIDDEPAPEPVPIDEPTDELDFGTALLSVPPSAEEAVPAVDAWSVSEIASERQAPVEEIVTLPSGEDVGFDAIASAFSETSPEGIRDLALEQPHEPAASPDVMLTEIGESTFEDHRAPFEAVAHYPAELPSLTMGEPPRLLERETPILVEEPVTGMIERTDSVFERIARDIIVEPDNQLPEFETLAWAPPESALGTAADTVTEPVDDDRSAAAAAVAVEVAPEIDVEYGEAEQEPAAALTGHTDEAPAAALSAAVDVAPDVEVEYGQSEFPEELAAVALADVPQESSVAEPQAEAESTSDTVVEQPEELPVEVRADVADQAPMTEATTETAAVQEIGLEDQAAAEVELTAEADVETAAEAEAEADPVMETEAEATAEVEPEYDQPQELPVAAFVDLAEEQPVMAAAMADVELVTPAVAEVTAESAPMDLSPMVRRAARKTRPVKALERFLRQVEARRLELHSGSVA